MENKILKPNWHEKRYTPECRRENYNLLREFGFSRKESSRARDFSINHIYQLIQTKNENT